MKKAILMVLSLFILMGCGQTIVLLPDLDGGVGEVVVTAKSGETVTLDKANQAVKGTGRVVELTDDQVQSVFGEALAAQPIPTARFLLYFQRGSDMPKDDSVALIPDIIEAYKERSSTDVSIVGHSDAVGDEEYNYTLSVRRAERVRQMLLDQGVNPESITLTSHGEANPLVPTPDGKPEPRNRRVEVLVR